ncbi:flavodoxin domain-containing protein [Lentzea sp. NBC_00516]|jgi:menaquinone-dependent protoporphyrinogen oxidase|uniref:Flavodoxin domain-containing protein n=1 Tax=Lentzea sokolovensis TaxID=3095429 RepID=A0ABU4URS6_9PSEU|nr:MULTISPECIES: flavodoxin domain-containing protein [unclassified Lentzea]MDX8141410.1 flavodoxin domain-containing protein [Lentzea sp. BCCO 10_0061]WUD27233.1 flavodoxin domain-containing protein [Lentzea sp. NBC_00516]
MEEILVAYATKMGSTREIAEAIAERIRSAAHEVTVQEAALVQSVAPYKAIVVGSALYAGRWHREAVKLLKRNEELLSRRPVWLFHSGPLGAELTPQRAPKVVRELAARIGADEPVTFGGRLTPETAVGFIAKKMARGEMAGDFRDWDKIALWANMIAERLVAAR